MKKKKERDTLEKGNRKRKREQIQRKLHSKQSSTSNNTPTKETEGTKGENVSPSLASSVISKLEKEKQKRKGN